jgi:hypothetical protein
MKKFKELLEDNKLINVKKSWSAIGGNDSKGDYAWDMKKKKSLEKDIKKRKPKVAYRTYSLSEKEWNKYFENGYTEIGNKNVEKGLCSFSTNKKMVKRFLGGGSETIVIEVKIKRYSEILNDSLYPEESELVTNNLEWKVTNIDDSSRNWWIIGKEI